MKTSVESNGTRNVGPDPMELGTTHRCTLTKEEYQELQSKNACFYCQKANTRHFACDCPLKKQRLGNGGKSLTLTVGASEAIDTDRDVDTLALGLKTASIDFALHLARKPHVEAKDDKNGVRIQEIEDSALEPREKEKNEPVDEIEASGVVLLFVSGCLNGFSVKFLIDNGANECFVDTHSLRRTG